MVHFLACLYIETIAIADNRSLIDNDISYEQAHTHSLTSVSQSVSQSVSVVGRPEVDEEAGVTHSIIHS